MKLKHTIAAAVLGLGVTFTAYAQQPPQLPDVIDFGVIPLEGVISWGKTVDMSLDGWFANAYNFIITDEFVNTSLSFKQELVSMYSDTGPHFTNMDHMAIYVYEGVETVLNDPLVLLAQVRANEGQMYVETFFTPEKAGQYTLVLYGHVYGNMGAYVLNVSASPMAAIPEPAEYAMLLAGLGVVGMAARRRKMKVN
ncbi:MAG: FxDxF family PEP-CTERM protein [Betaproteobacteria bacterium]|nr:FxDxF family PEP-CTERM protein [Betaproteobacteria bacterium]